MKKKVITIVTVIIVGACCIFGFIACRTTAPEKTEINESVNTLESEVNETEKTISNIPEKALKLTDKEMRYTKRIQTGRNAEKPEGIVSIRLAASDDTYGTDNGSGASAGQPVPAASGSYTSTEMGGYGRFDIPGFGFSLPLSYGMSQGIVDAWNLGAIFEYGEVLVIADHNYQGFSVIKNCYIGATAQLVTYSGTISLVCTGVDYNCYHNGQLHESSGGTVGYGGCHAGELVCYTCNDDDGYSITMAFWAPVSGSLGISGVSSGSASLSNSDPADYSYSGPVLSTMSIYYFCYTGSYQQTTDHISTYESGAYYTLPSCMFNEPAGKRFRYWGYDRNGTYAGAPGDALWLDANSVTRLYAIWEDVPQNTEPSTTYPTQPATQPTTQPPTEAPTETPTQPPTEAPTEPPTEAPTEAPTEPPTEAPTEPPTEPPTELPEEPPIQSEESPAE